MVAREARGLILRWEALAAEEGKEAEVARLGRR